VVWLIAMLPLIPLPIEPAQGLRGSETAARCPVTAAARAFEQPSPSTASRFWYGSEGLAVLLSAGGKWRGMGPAHSYRDKLFWWRQDYDGSVEGSPALQVTARRLDGEASVSIPPRVTGAKHENFGGWAMLVALEFPTAGCWQVTGKYRSETLSFVVEVGE
jgi:hypothetical protein